MSAYIGREPTLGNLEVQVLPAFNGTLNTVNLNYAVGSASSLLVVLNGVLQQPSVAYSVSLDGTVLTFAEPPIAESDGYIIYLGKQISVPRAVGQTVDVQSFTGDNVGKDFVLQEVPVVPEAIIVVVDGLIQKLGTNFTLSGSTLSFVVAPPLGAEIEVIFLAQEKVSIDTVRDQSITRVKFAPGALVAEDVVYAPEGVGATATTVGNDLNRRAVSLLRWTNDRMGATDIFDAANAAWTYCLANGYDLYIPSGRYIVKRQANWPFGRINGLSPTSLLDCKNITIFGDGPSTILETETVNGADVLQFNGAKNLHVRNLKLTATVSGSVSGSNGISITGGWDNITIDGVEAENLASLDKGTFVDGGKALTIQPGTTVNECGTLKARIIARGCAEGFGTDYVISHLLSKNTAIDVDVIAEDCYYCIKIAGAEATTALTAGDSLGIKVQGIAVNCQHDLALVRAHGVDAKVQVKTTKSAADRTLNPLGVQWRATELTVDALVALGIKNSDIEVIGFKGACDYKAQIGGITQGSSGLAATSEDCRIYLDIGGTATITAVNPVNSGGNILAESRLTLTGSTSPTISSDFYLAARENTIEIIGEPGQNLLQGNLRFPATQVSSADVNTLDDYEEGTFVPTLADTNLVDEGATYSIQAGFYTKIGNTVHFTLTLQMTGLGALTPADNAFVIGLPFTSQNISGNIAACKVSNVSGVAFSAAAVMGASVATNNSFVTLRKTLATSTTGDVNMTVGEVSATGLFVISGTYRVAS